MHKQLQRLKELADLGNPQDVDAYQHRLRSAGIYTPYQVEFEPSIFLKDNGQPKDFTFPESLDRLRKKGFDRHMRPTEYFGLLFDGVHGHLQKNPELEQVYENTLRQREFLSLAWERKGDELIAYLDPEGIEFVVDSPEHKISKYPREYRKTSSFNYSIKKVFSVKGIENINPLPLDVFSDKFIVWHFGMAFTSLPESLQERRFCPRVFLPKEGEFSPVYKQNKEYNYFTDRLAMDLCYYSPLNGSRGVKEKKY